MISSDAEFEISEYIKHCGPDGDPQEIRKAILKHHPELENENWSDLDKAIARRQADFI